MAIETSQETKAYSRNSIGSDLSILRTLLLITAANYEATEWLPPSRFPPRSVSPLRPSSQSVVAELGRSPPVSFLEIILLVKACDGLH